MLKILIITEVFYPENGLVNDFAVELTHRGFQVDILTQQPSYPIGYVFDNYTNAKYSRELWQNITIHRFRIIEGYKESKLKKILNYWTFVRLGRKIAKRIGNQYDHIFVYQTGPLTVALPGVYIHKKFHKPLTIWTFDIWPDAVYAYGFPPIQPLKAFVNKIIRIVYQNCDHILVSSKKFTETIRSYVPNKTIVYAPNWLLPETPQPSRLRLNSEIFNFTFAGNISKAQNLENVLLGWKKAHFPVPAMLNIVGEGSALDSIKAIVAKYDIQNVHFHGRYPSNEIEDILCQSHVLILPLLADAGIQKTEPFKLQSYLKVGKPILGIAQGSIQDIIEENKLGLCAIPDNVDDIAQKFHAMIAFAQEHRATIKTISNTLLVNRFNRKIILERIISQSLSSTPSANNKD